MYADVTNQQSLNKYQYMFNNPLRYVDPDGRAPQDWKCKCVAQAGVKNADFLVNGIKVELKLLGADAIGNTLKNIISRAVGQGGGNVLIDARAAITRAEAEKAAARVFGADARLNVLRIVGQEFDITIARQAQ